MKLRRVIWLVLLAAVVLVNALVAVGSIDAATVSGDRSTVTGGYAIELDGVMVGRLLSAEGGNATGVVINEKIGPDYVIKKHIAGIKYEDITVTCGTGMSKIFFQWLKDTINFKKNPRKNGAIIQTDLNGKEVSRLNFTNAMITQISFPTLDAASRDAAKMSITIAPQYTQQAQGSGKTIPQMGGVIKKWLPNNFKLTIAGLDTTKVNKIDALVFKQVAVRDAVGSGRDSAKISVQQEIPNLVISFAEVSAQTFRNWYGDFVIKGNNGDTVEKNGTLQYLSPDLREQFFTLTFKGIGIFRLVPEKVEAGSDNIRRLKAEMYVEDMAFDFKSTF